MERIPVKQVKEIILVTADAVAARRFYRDVLGLAMPETADRWNLAPVGPQFLGASQAGVMAYPGFTGRVHLGLEIDHADLGPAVERLRQHGIEVTLRPQPSGYMGTPEAVGAYFLDPDGNLIELWAALPPGEATSG
jgi:catechol 2,3-dioxygenase-like lactoylglutathione lyase family enzyme